MGAGTMIATAIAITLLIITGYVLISGTLSTAQLVAMAQQAAAERETHKMHTRVEIVNATLNTDTSQTFVEVKNTGSEVVGDFNHMEVYLLQGGVPYTYTNLVGIWTYAIQPDQVNPGLLDPDEIVNITVPYEAARGDPSWVKVTTVNGVYDSAYLPCSPC